MSSTLFELPVSTVRRMDILPVSVLEISNQSSERRSAGGHSEESSRCQYSHFPREVSSLCLDLYLRDCTHIFDPFAGWGERHSACLNSGKRYTGFDVSKDSVDAALRVYGVENILADSSIAPIPRFDGLLTCPPYWNLERYSDAGIDSAQTWREFIDRYSFILGRCYEAASNGAVFCFMVGDWRSDGVYYDLSNQTRKIMDGLGATILDEVIVSRRTVSKIKIMLPQAIRLGYTVKVHETLTVWKKR